jgi:hypothetical protein
MIWFFFSWEIRVCVCVCIGDVLSESSVYYERWENEIMTFQFKSTAVIKSHFKDLTALHYSMFSLFIPWLFVFVSGYRHILSSSHLTTS